MVSSFILPDCLLFFPWLLPSGFGGIKRLFRLFCKIRGSYGSLPSAGAIPAPAERTSPFSLRNRHLWTARTNWAVSNNPSFVLFFHKTTANSLLSFRVIKMPLSRPIPIPGNMAKLLSYCLKSPMSKNIAVITVCSLLLI